MKIPFQPVETSFLWIYLWNLVGVRFDFQPVVYPLPGQGTRLTKRLEIETTTVRLVLRQKGKIYCPPAVVPALQ